MQPLELFFHGELADHIVEMSNQHATEKRKVLLAGYHLVEENVPGFWESLSSLVMYSSHHIKCIGKRHQMYNTDWLRMQ